jgi:hypothetical protein
VPNDTNILIVIGIVIYFSVALFMIRKSAAFGLVQFIVIFPIILGILIFIVGGVIGLLLYGWVFLMGYI